nr:hypothetical protein [uncultured Prevotella sp.]
MVMSGERLYHLVVWNFFKYIRHHGACKTRQSLEQEFDINTHSVDDGLKPEARLRLDEAVKFNDMILSEYDTDIERLYVLLDIESIFYCDPRTNLHNGKPLFSKPLREVLDDYVIKYRGAIGEG